MQGTGRYFKYTKYKNIVKAKTKSVKYFKELCLSEVDDWSEIRKNTLKGHATFPSMVVKYFYMLNKWKVTENNTIKNNPNNRKSGR